MEKFPNNFLQNAEQKENKIEKPRVKEGVNFVFEKYPELANIGTMEQYSEYLDNVFPDSKVKDIVYHGARNKFKKFDIDKGWYGGRNFGKGIYTTPKKNWAKEYAEDKDDYIFPLVLNVKNPVITCNHYKDFHGAYFHIQRDEKITKYISNDSIINYEYLNRDLLKKVNDWLIEYIGEKDDKGFPVYQKNIRTNPEIREILVPETEQAYFLGFDQDIENFKKFVADRNKA